ncbi:hypothetical protein SO802_006004 [Lithocarpus litseifolius]|uniref:Reverse transcriptase zinc-binding domain-containing protein n=1 Tax=Lithocarpus litseifolius TaxID=425828 RepID=A0AAW2DQ94_9ROSI
MMKDRRGWLITFSGSNEASKLELLRAWETLDSVFSCEGTSSQCTCSQVDECLNTVELKVTPDMQQILSIAFTTEEIKTVVFQMGPTKALEPDARYFPRCHFLDVVVSPNCSFVWMSIMSAMPILRSGSCWRVGSGESIKVLMDKWIPNYPTNRVLHSVHEGEEDWRVSNLVDSELHEWRRVSDVMVWLHNRKGIYSVKSGYHVARKVLRECVECSTGLGQQVWKQLWKVRVPNKMKVFAWRACQEILPTRVNLAKRKIIRINTCCCCQRALETVIHAIWECLVAQDVWAGSSTVMQKCSTNFNDFMQLFEVLMNRLDAAGLEFFLIQAWTVWNQRNTMEHDGQMKDPHWLNRRAAEYLEEYKRRRNIWLLQRQHQADNNGSLLHRICSS